MQKILLFCITIVAVSCSASRPATYINYHFKAADGRPDYSNLDYWAAHPWKHDMSDSVPRPLRKDYHADSSVDVFFLYPTTYTDRNEPYGLNAPIDDSAINQKTDNTTILKQASIFNAAGRVFSPRYRQANYFAYFPADTAAAKAAFDTAYADIKAAFQYYMAHYNNGRPIIIASHSQGTTHAKLLLKEFFDGKPLQKQLVAAYIVGIPVKPDYFTSIPACTSPSQTGCVCSWRTFREGYTDTVVNKEKFTAIVTNPLTWDSSKPSVSRFANKGAVLLKFNKLNKNVAGATIHNGVLWTAKPRFFGNVFLKSPSYHIADYNLYYLSVRQNAQLRVNAFLKR